MPLLLSTSNPKFFSKVVFTKKRTVSRPLLLIILFSAPGISSCRMKSHSTSHGRTHPHILPRIQSAPAFMLTAAPSPVPAPASPAVPSSSQRAPSAY